VVPTASAWWVTTDAGGPFVVVARDLATAAVHAKKQLSAGSQLLVIERLPALL
jgi:hypothetical protein